MLLRIRRLMPVRNRKMSIRTSKACRPSLFNSGPALPLPPCPRPSSPELAPCSCPAGSSWGRLGLDRPPRGLRPTSWLEAVPEG
eukprot:1450744-Rhodomonas_salina.1